MKKIKLLALFAFLFLFLPHSAKAQVPSFDCSKSIQVYTDVTTGNVYSCKITAGVGTWMLAGGSGGTFGPNYSIGGGTAQAQTVAPTTAITDTTLVPGYHICWLPVANNTGANPTLSGSGTSTFTGRSILKPGGSGLIALIANDLTTQNLSCAIFDGTWFELENPQAGITVSGSISTGTGSTACGAGTTGCDAYVESSVACTPVAGQACRRLDATLHNFAIELNGGIETPEPVFSVVPAGSKCLQSSGVAGLIVEATNACGGSAFPITVTGGVSGGIPYFSSTTVESASPILNTGFLMKGGGAGNPPTNSLCDEGATTANTITCTDTAGIVAPKFVSNGSTAGFVDYPQGSTSAAVAPCNTANSWCVQAPTAVTAGVETQTGVHAQGIPFNTGTSSAIQDGTSGDTNHSLTVTTGSGTSISSALLCSSTFCPAGTYVVHAYIDITTACGTTGTYLVNLVYTDDQGAKTVPINLNGTGAVPATGVLTTTSTANFGENSQVIRLTSGNLNYSTTAVACGTAGPMVGKLYLSATPVM